MGLNQAQRLLIFLKYLNNFPNCLEDIDKKYYLCIVKILKGHEAAAPNKAAYFVPRCKRNNVATAWASGNTPKGASFRSLDSA